jgi:Na+/H+ antiporter NhaC
LQLYLLSTVLLLPIVLKLAMTLSLINVLFLPIGLKLAMIFHWPMSVFVDWTEACNDLSRLFAFCQLGLKQIAIALFPMFVVMLHCKSWKPVSTVREFSLKCL